MITNPNHRPTTQMRPSPSLSLSLPLAFPRFQMHYLSSKRPGEQERSGRDDKPKLISHPKMEEPWRILALVASAAALASMVAEVRCSTRTLPLDDDIVPLDGGCVRLAATTTGQDRAVSPTRKGAGVERNERGG